MGPATTCKPLQPEVAAVQYRHAVLSTGSLATVAGCTVDMSRTPASVHHSHMQRHINALVGGAVCVTLLLLPLLLQGANLPSLTRALVACAWFGIQTWIGGSSIHQMLVAVWGEAVPSAVIAALGITSTQLACFMAFWTVQVGQSGRVFECVVFRVLRFWGAVSLGTAVWQQQPNPECFEVATYTHIRLLNCWRGGLWTMMLLATPCTTAV